MGGRRKGFDIALIDEERLVRTWRRAGSPQQVVEALEPYRPSTVGIDSPCCPAPRGRRLREGERLLRSAVCGIRWTPDQDRLDEGTPYFEWLRLGLDLHRQLGKRAWHVIEVFPTASWTRWVGPRQEARAAWTRNALARLPLGGLPKRTNQDVRDAIAAAVTARQFAAGETDAFGTIIVPKPGPPFQGRARRAGAALP